MPEQERADEDTGALPAAILTLAAAVTDMAAQLSRLAAVAEYLATRSPWGFGT